MLRLHGVVSICLSLAVLGGDYANAQNAPTGSRLLRSVPLGKTEAVIREPSSGIAPAPIERLKAAEKIGGDTRAKIPKRGDSGANVDRNRLRTSPVESAPSRSRPPSSRQDIAATLAELGAEAPFDLSASGQYLVAAETKGAGLVLCDVPSGRRLRRLENSNRRYALVEISGDARWIAAVPRDDSDRVDLWRADNGRQIGALEAPGGAKRMLAFSAAGDQLRVLAQNGDGLVFSVPAGAVLSGFGTRSGGSAAEQPAVQAPPLAPRVRAAPNGETAKPRIRSAPYVVTPREATPAESGPESPATSPKVDSAAPPTIRRALPETKPTLAPQTATKPAPRHAGPKKAAKKIVPPSTPEPSSPEPRIAAPQPRIAAPQPRIAAPQPRIVAPQPRATMPQVNEGAAGEEPSGGVAPPSPFDNVTSTLPESAAEPAPEPIPEAATESPREATEPTRETAESPREATEPTPETAESPREAAEPPREATESPREAAEPTPETTESPREAAEPTRETAESPREAAEPTREATESPREAAEPTREAAESPREAAEPPREAAEPAGTPPGTGADAAAEPAGEGPAAPDGATIAQRAESAPDAATQPPSKPKDAVTVHFATNRNRLAPKDRQWLVYFKGFFFTLPAIVIYALVILALLILPWFGKRSWAAYALVTGAVALCAMGSLEAYVRSQLRDELSGELFGSRPTELSYGACEVSVPLPENRQSGELNRPVSVWVFEAPENPEKHFMLRKVTEHADKDAFFSSLSAEIEQAGVPAAMLFIHGYNVSFEDAIFRTAQLAVDLKFPGAAVTFSWPSYADPVKYTFDEQNAEVSIPALGEFLQDLAAKSGAQRIHVIAHSMGNRVLAGAMENMDRESRERNRKIFREVVLAAPDIDRRVFESQVLPHIAENTQHCTLYASSRDRALLISRYFHNYQRLGETEPELIVAQGMDTIDASLVDTSLLGHSYIGDVQSIVSDLHDLMVGGKGPMERLGLESFRRGDMTYWSIKPRLEAATDAPLRR